MKLVAYVRVSTDQQAEHGHGPDVQRRAITNWAKQNGHRVAVWASDEGISGSNGLDAREGLLEALAALRERRAGALVVYRLDRLARDIVLQETLLREISSMGARVHSTAPSEDAYLDPNGEAEDPSRALIRQILAAVAGYERAMIRLRMASGKARKKELGGFVGGTVPYGYRSESGDLVPDPSEQDALSFMRSLRDAGSSYRSICAALNKMGIQPRRGTWQPATVSLILQRQSHRP